MRISWTTSAQYLFRNTRFSVSIPFSRGLVPIVQTAKYNPITDSLELHGYMKEPPTAPKKRNEVIDLEEPKKHELR